MNTVSNCHLNSYFYTFRLMQLSDLTIHASLCKDNSQSKSSQLVRVTHTVSLEYSAVTVTITLLPQRMRGRREITREKQCPLDITEMLYSCTHDCMQRTCIRSSQSTFQHGGGLYISFHTAKELLRAEAC